ncbi:MAG: hypothetical protein Q8O55_07705, partial [Dehalococcoidales bacterium]|nr:hypothetical protein [Dehalococcoidales bacterium]
PLGQRRGLITLPAERGPRSVVTEWGLFHAGSSPGVEDDSHMWVEKFRRCLFLTRRDVLPSDDHIF